ncbi:MAG TPA: ESPR-type extended signal peptide-containing protein, partial [Rhodanobacteraceae bacterium]
MNKKIYSLVWNKSLNQIIVASELATCKSAGGSAGTVRGVPAVARLALAVLLAIGATPLAFAGQAFCPGGSASGKGALACGKGSVASGIYSTAIGTEAIASGDYSSAFG